MKTCDMRLFCARAWCALYIHVSPPDAIQLPCVEGPCTSKPCRLHVCTTLECKCTKCIYIYVHRAVQDAPWCDSTYCGDSSAVLSYRSVAWSFRRSHVFRHAACGMPPTQSNETLQLCRHIRASYHCTCFQIHSVVHRGKNIGAVFARRSTYIRVRGRILRTSVHRRTVRRAW